MTPLQYDLQNFNQACCHLCFLNLKKSLLRNLSRRLLRCLLRRPLRSLLRHLLPRLLRKTSVNSIFENHNNVSEHFEYVYK